MSAKPARRAVLWLAALVSVVVALLGVLVLGEVIIRVTDFVRYKQNQGRVSWAVHDEDLGYRLRAGFGDVNAQGLRDDPVETPKNKVRVLILGDSLVFNGEDPADTVPGHLERVLRADGRAAPTEVLNAGVRGYTNYQELVYLKKYGLAFAPDVVGVAFVLNDLHRILTRFRVENGQIVGETYTFTDDAVKGVGSPVYRLARRSRFLVWLRARLSVFDDLVDFYAGQGFSFDYRPDFNTAWKPERWGDIEAQLGEMITLGREHGFRVFLVAFPFGDQLRPDYLARDRAYVLYPQTRLAEITARLGIPYLDLFSRLELSHFEDDRIHLTKHGRAIAGEQIARFLVDARLLPGQYLGAPSHRSGGRRDQDPHPAAARARDGDRP